METNYKQHAFLTGSVALAAIALLALAMSVTEYKSWKHANGQLPTITVTGEGEVTAVPDIATITFTVRETKKTVPEAQKATEAKVKEALAAIKKLGVAEKDIKTLSYTVNPKYEYNQIYCITVPCPQGKNTLVGYDVANTIQIKVRKVDTAGDVLGAIGTANITEVTGPDFTVDDMDKVQADAKEKAIADAKAKAKRTASSLGVSLGAISQYNEDGGYQPPMYYKAEMSVMSAGVARDSVSVPQGESVIKARVTITYTLD
ncbi:MAG: uncharacterized protein QG653_653 [Patescibacteria group bacterium]|nr:uncharacterized protein [Patescibacteria group bacterium]